MEERKRGYTLTIKKPEFSPNVSYIKLSQSKRPLNFCILPPIRIYPIKSSDLILTDSSLSSESSSELEDDVISKLSSSKSNRKSIDKSSSIIESRASFAEARDS